MVKVAPVPQLPPLPRRCLFGASQRIVEAVVLSPSKEQVMSTNQPIDPIPEWQPPKPGDPKPVSRWRVKRFGWLGIVVAVVVTWILAAVLLGPSTTAPIAAPAPTVTATATATETVTTAAVPPEMKSPDSCLEALDYADKGFAVSSDVIGVAAKVIQLMPKVVDAVLAYDADEIEKIAKKVRGYTGDIESYSQEMGDLAPKYNAAKAECRGE